VEVLATGEDSLQALDQGVATQAMPHSDDAPMPTNFAPVRPAAAKMAAAPSPATPVHADAAQLAMSTLSFQDYVRERMMRRRQEAPATADGSAPAGSAVADARTVAHPIEASARSAAPAPAVSPQQPTTSTESALPRGLMQELQAMKALIEERFDTLTWLGQTRQHPIQSNLMLKLIRAGYSPTLARALLERMPESLGAAESVRWVMDVLERNLHTDAEQASLVGQGGVFALVGTTGVGKTTTAAKLAGLCARTHGPSSVGLITLDTYRVGAHDQLRTYGRLLGVVAHLAHDRAALQDLLQLLGNKKMVLIDTTGVAPSDPRKRGVLDGLDIAGVNRLLVLNAGSHGDTLDDAVASFGTRTGQSVVLSKIDEAVKLGPALDAAIRHHLQVRGVTNGQQVPEDWDRADAAKLVRQSMRASLRASTEPKADELGFYFADRGRAGELDA
jgi:flagellar biosynthesis protein FlhF